MFPIRCYTCNMFIGQYYNDWVKRISNEEHARSILDSHQINRMCCRRMFLTYVHVTADLLQYSNIDQVMDECGTFMYLEPEETCCVNCD